MKKKIFVVYALAAVIALLAFEYAFWSNGFDYLEKQSEDGYLKQTELLKEVFIAQNIVEENRYDEFAEAYGSAYGIRITIIDDNGIVLGESESEEGAMSNHLDRVEVQKALQGESNSLIRRSDTLDVKYCYCAVPVDMEGFNGVIRVAVPMEELRGMNGEFLRSAILTGVILLMLVIFLGMYFKKYVMAMKKIERMRKEFVSNVTHELKTPLTSIRGFVETLKAGAIHDEVYAHKFLDIIEIETERLSNLIDDTLVLSEIESKKESKIEPCDINQLIKEVVELLEPKVKEHVRLIFKPSDMIKPYNCNRDRIKQLMINLVDNALKATEFGAVTITCRNIEDQLVIQIADTGIGMEEEQLERIFERFYRVDKGRSKAQGGTGLGLSIVKHIVEMYHGTVTVTSKVGIGTEFVVKLPYQKG